MLHKTRTGPGADTSATGKIAPSQETVELATTIEIPVDHMPPTQLGAQATAEALRSAEDKPLAEPEL